MKPRLRARKEHFQRGIYILPNLFTSLNLFCGFFAIISAIKGNLIQSASLILVALMFDILEERLPGPPTPPVNLVLIFIAAKPSLAMFMFGIVYIISGPFNTVKNVHQKKVKNREVQDPRSSLI